MLRSLKDSSVGVEGSSAGPKQEQEASLIIFIWSGLEQASDGQESSEMDTIKKNAEPVGTNADKLVGGGRRGTMGSVTESLGKSAAGGRSVRTQGLCRCWACGPCPEK